MTAPVRYGDHVPAEPGTPCRLCGVTSKRLGMDHCHAHGWARGYLCHRCNTLMAFIDRRVSIRDETLSTPLTLAAMVAYATGCPECESFGVEDLGDTDSLRFFGSLGRKKGGRVETVVRITLTEAEHAQMSMIAASEFRSPSNLGKAWIRQRLASLRESASQTGDPA